MQIIIMHLRGYQTLHKGRGSESELQEQEELG